jgi:hypothetical protein
MDPLGLALDQYGPTGVPRTADNFGFPVDPSGELQGTRFSGPEELVAIIKRDPDQRFAGCLAQEMLTYALGRGLTDADQCALANLKRSFQASGYKLRDLAVQIAMTDAFRMRRGESEGGQP